MTLVGFLCVLGAIGLLAVGLAQGDSNLVWASIAASALGGVAVIVAAIQRDRALRRVEIAADGSSGPSTGSEPTSQAPAKVFRTDELPTVDARYSDPAGDRGATSTDSADDIGHVESAEADDSTETGEGLDPVDEPAEEEVGVADVLTVIDLIEEVLVVDLRPRYHLARCEHLEDREVIPLPVNEAREDGFTPCSLCRPDAALAAAARQVRSADN